MQQLARFALIILLVCPRAAAAFTVLPSELNGWTWFQSTILGGIGQPGNDLGREASLAVPGTAKTLKIRQWHTGNPRGLALILPGTGGNPQSGLANVMAENFAQLGFDSMIVANPFSPEFQESFSTDGLIGLPQRDLSDAHRMLLAAYQKYVEQFGKPRRLILTGISLGALYAALEALHPQELRLDEVLLLNPPTSLRAGINQLDDMIRISIAESDPLPFNFPVVWAYLQAQRGTSLENIRGIKMFLPENEREGRRLIGDSFRQALTAVGKGLLKLDEPTLGGSVRQRIAAGLSTLTFARLMSYSGSALAERHEINGSVESALAQASLVSVLQRAEALPAVTVITNADDFLLRPGDLPRLEKILGDHLYVFAAGGHCGNYWTPSFRSVLAKILH